MLYGGSTYGSTTYGGRFGNNVAPIPEPEVQIVGGLFGIREQKRIHGSLSAVLELPKLYAGGRIFVPVHGRVEYRLKEPSISFVARYDDAILREDEEMILIIEAMM